MMMHSVSQDPAQSSGEGGELVHTLSKETSPDASELGSPRSTPHFDLFNIVVSYKRMALFLEPVADAVELTRFLLGWKMPVCSLLVCIFLNVFFCTVNEVGWFTVGVLALCAPAALGYLQDRCGGRASEDELQKRRYHTVHRRDLQTVHLTKQEAMLEVKDLLKHLDDMLSSACLSAEAIYKVLYWDNHTKSSRFYGGMLILVCLLYVAPVGWVLAGLNSAIFLWNRDFCKVLLDLGKLFHLGQTQTSEGTCEEQQQGNLLDRTPTPTSLEEDDDGPLGAPEYDTISENGLLSRNEPIRSKVSKLTEKLRKRYPTTATGNCSSCNAVFSVLKKRFHNLQELRHSASLANKVFIQRDYSEGTTCKFQTKFPSELESRIERTLFEDTVKTLNNYYAEAEKIGGQSYLEGCLACATAYLIFLCMETRYEKVLKKIAKYIQEQNEKIYAPRGLLITDPIERGMRVIEISIYEDRGSSGSSSGSSSVSGSTAR
ncbi:Protrudin [Nibea albiflora]|uniref:Protrudin n=1 Tax=Nibea albiflora TaxID=240163 RepID=A0ACB7FKY0_NIBAL|nr:Protrudin [Nibea albiflora]